MNSLAKNGRRVCPKRDWIWQGKELVKRARLAKEAHIAPDNLSASLGPQTSAVHPAVYNDHGQPQCNQY
jgi:hypothetical protein